jgi:hypothetical protein
VIDIVINLKDRGGAAKLRELQQGLSLFNVRVAVGTPLVYGYGINYGRHRSGKLARRAGPSNFLSDPFQQAQGKLKADVTATLQSNPVDLPNTLMRAGFDIQREAQQRVPKVTRALQRSVVTRKI